MTIDKEILDCFFEESTELLNDLTELGQSLKGVGIPNAEESERLAEFGQKLNRLIGGTASVGFDAFAPLSRKTAMLAEKCAGIKDITIRLLIMNLNNVVALFTQCLQDMESMEKGEPDVETIEKKIEICLTATGVRAPEVKSQNEIDDLLGELGL
jgi:chemotaxis protein histidine kinase CheA